MSRSYLFTGALVGATSDGPITDAQGWYVYAAQRDAAGGFLNHYGYLPNERPIAASRDESWLVVATDKALRIIPAAWTSTPTRSLPLPAPARSLWTADGVAYVLCADGRMWVASFRDPASATWIDSEALEGTDLVVSGELAIVASSGGLQVRRLWTGLGAPVATATAAVSLSDLPAGLAPYRNGVAVAAGAAGVRYLEVASPSQLTNRWTQNYAQARQVERLGRRSTSSTGRRWRRCSRGKTGTSTTPPRRV